MHLDGTSDSIPMNMSKIYVPNWYLMYHFPLGTRITAFPTKLFGVPLNPFLPCLSATTAYLSPVPLAPPAVVALLGLLLGELSGKLTETGAKASVAGCFSLGGGVLGPIVGVLKRYSSTSTGTYGGAITTVPGRSITSVFGSDNKAPPSDYAAMIFLSIAPIINAMVNFFESRMGTLVPVTYLDLYIRGQDPS